jgi:hypothetical protein
MARWIGETIFRQHRAGLAHRCEFVDSFQAASAQL